MTIVLSSSTATKLSLSNDFRHENPPASSHLFPGFCVDNNKRKKIVSSFGVTCCVKNQSTNKPTEKLNNGRLVGRVLSEGRDEDESYAPICPGCGVFMQDNDQNLPGFYQKREISEEGFEEELDDEDEVFDDDDLGGIEAKNVEPGSESGFDEWDVELPEEDLGLDLDGFSPPGVGYGNMTKEVLARRKREKVSKAEKRRAAKERARAEKARHGEATVCARCHSLRNYGAVKNQSAENLIPDFDFERLISTRMTKRTGNANVVIVVVVDCVDFDGSFPKQAAKSLFKLLGESEASKKRLLLPKIVLVATKVDLLPSQISPTRLDRWVRQRARAAGAQKLSGVYLVSSRKDLGVRNLLSFVKDLAGPRGSVWVIGAQNAGKSTLINVLAKKEGAKVTKLTEAPVPGTTLGILRVGGILPAKAKFFDTPGLLHPYLVSMRLNREEQKMVEIRKELQPRSYRMKVGQTVHVGGLMRLDLIQASVDTIYVTVWASPNVSLHMGKTENAEETWTKHVGIRLQPPIGVERASEIGTLEAREIKVSGTSWDTNSIDIAVAGLGWFSVGLKGEAMLRLWTLDGVEVTEREPLVLDRARVIERPGFWLPKAISEAIGNQSKLEARMKKLQDDLSLFEVSG